MNDQVRLSLAHAQVLATRALAACGCSEANAQATARALVAAEADGQGGHGLSRIPSYALQLKALKVDGRAQPRLEQVAGAALRVDAASGFSYPAIDLALAALTPLARSQGIALAAIHRSHHFGQAGRHVERLADQGLIGLLLGNTPKAMAFHGGRRPMLGTNPIAFAAPLADAAPLVIDLALSVAARGRIVAAQAAGAGIPAGWAVDAQGHPTTDPSAALAGTLLPIGGAKGGALALMIELLGAALTGSAFGWEASSFFDDQGGPPNMGQVLIAMDPGPVSAGAYASRMGVLLAAMNGEPEVRLPGLRRLERRATAARDGVAIPAGLHAGIERLIATAQN